MIIHDYRHTDVQLGQAYLWYFMSDLHIGSANADHQAITRDLRRAREVGANVLINGDVFDAIGPSDKRFDLTCLHADISREKDLSNAIVDMAADLLGDYADIIKIIGIGNHDEAWVLHNHGDPVRALIKELTRRSPAEANIRHGSYWGYIQTTFSAQGAKLRAKHKTLYYHGAGGDSPVTKGTIDFNRKGRNWAYDCLTFGHKHNLLCSVDQMADVDSRGKYTEWRQLNIQTGSYYRNYKELDQKTALNISYAARKAFPPKPIGGMFLCLRPVLDDDGKLRVKQDFMSDVVGATPQKRRRPA